MGTVLAQLINVLVQPILTRIVPTEYLGIYTYVVSLATMIIPVASLKLDMLIVTAKSDEEAQYITDTCVCLVVLISIAYLIVIFVGYNVSLKNVFNKYGPIVFWTPLLVLTNGIRFLFISYNNRYKKYKLISKVALMRETARAVIQIVAGFFWTGAVGQVLGYAISPLLGLRVQTTEFLEKFRKRKRITGRKIFEIVTNSGRKQILYLVPAQFINSFSATLITLSITALYSAKALGYYSTGVRILEIPLIFITSNVSKVVYQQINECKEEGKPILKMILSVVIVLLVVSFTGFGILYAIAPFLAEKVFGNGYSIAGLYIRCLCLMYALRLVATSFAGVYTVFGKQWFEFVLNIFLVVFGVGAYILSNTFGLEIEQYLWLVGFGYSFVYFCMFFGYVILCYKHDKELAAQNS